jgi:hypothetical protein
LMYLHRYEEANEAIAQARLLDPDSFWGRSTQANILLQKDGDTEAAVQLMIGAQHSNDLDFFDGFMSVNIFARRYEDALVAARQVRSELEIRRGGIILREDWAAQILFHMGRHNEAKQAAAAALFRLKGLRTQLGEDYRIDLAEARVSAIQGVAPDKLRALVKKSMSSAPTDELAAFQNQYIYAQIFGMAGMVSDVIETLDSIWLPPSDTSAEKVNVDPAFDGIRNDPDFVAMLEEHK